jgi:hypothetical protein
MTNLQYRVKDLQSQVDKYKTGEKLEKMRGYYESCIAGKDREIKNLKNGLAKANGEVAEARAIWQQVIDDLVAEHGKELRKKDRIIIKLETRVSEMQGKLEAEKNRYKEKVKELYQYQIKTELEDEKGKIRKLKAQINRDHENSSNPSSMKPNRKKITNNREKTGRKPGGQPGHTGHPRKKHEPTIRVEIPSPEKYTQPDYKETGRIITKQLIDIRVSLDVIEYYTPEYRDTVTGQRVHAQFPDGLVNEVTYGGTIKAFAFILNNRCNVSIIKTSDFLSELTNGRLKVSAGMINSLSKEFSKKTEEERKKIFADLLLSPVMYTDFATVKENGVNRAVLVCANGDNILFFAKEHKGHKGIEGTPVETYQNILVHDHEKTFYGYGGGHQECLEHVRRYLKDSMINEPSLSWNSQMRQLINEMMHFKKNLDPYDNRNPDVIEPAKVADFEVRYDDILALAQSEYDYEPPNKYYMEGFNLYIRLGKYKVHHLLFLHDKNVDPTNNLSERHLRNLKRKFKQVMSFRSWDGLAFYCESMGVITSIVKQDINLFEAVASIFMKQSDSNLTA